MCNKKYVCRQLLMGTCIKVHPSFIIALNCPWNDGMGVSLRKFWMDGWMQPHDQLVGPLSICHWAANVINGNLSSNANLSGYLSFRASTGWGFPVVVYFTLLLPTTTSLLLASTDATLAESDLKWRRWLMTFSSVWDLLIKMDSRLISNPLEGEGNW